MKKIASSVLSVSLILVLFAGLLPLVVFADGENELIFDEVEAGAALLVDANYDAILYEKNANAQMHPASITKVMTALLVIEAIDRGELTLNTVLTTNESALFDITADSSTQNIQAGEKMSVEHLLYCLMLASANEAANILAEGVSGSVDAFVAAMNTRAEELGMTGTRYENTHGLHRDEHYTTAYDIYLLTREAMTHGTFQKIVSTDSHTVPATNLSESRVFYNTNALLTNWTYKGYTYSYATGVKTGYTPEAGYCLASSAQKGERFLIAVVLNAENPTDENGSRQRLQFSESRRLFQHGFDDFQAQALLSPTNHLIEVPVTLGKDVAHVTVRPSAALDAMLPVTYEEELREIYVDLYEESVQAPIAKGQVLGTISVSYDGNLYGTTELIADYAVERSMMKWVFSLVGGLLTNPILWVVALVFFLIILFRYLRALRRTPRRQQQKRNHSSKSAPKKGRPRQ